MSKASKVFLCALLTLPAAFASGSLKRTASVRSTGAIHGAAFDTSGALYTWGDGLGIWAVPGLRFRLLAQGQFEEGGCLVDLDRDGRPEFVTQEGSGLGKLVWRRPPDWQPKVIDTEIAMHDCMEATLFGRRGVLMIQRYMQVRFYELPLQDGEPWRSRDIYSIYTPSQQAGLNLHDVDGDGHTDIYCGNYWIRSPDSFELPWRIFAINTYSEGPLSAMLRLAKAGQDLVVSQSHIDSGRITWFEKPSDPKQMWIDHRLSDSMVRPHGLAVTDLNGDGNPDVVVGEQNGAQSRITVFWNEGDYRFRQESVPSGGDIVNLWALPGRRILAAGSREVSIWSYRRK